MGRRIAVAIVFGGRSSELRESVRATRILYHHALQQLAHRYRFEFFCIAQHNTWATAAASERIIVDARRMDSGVHIGAGEAHEPHRLVELAKADVLYATCMGSCGESGNVAGLADLLNVPLIGSDIMASALALDKRKGKIVAQHAGVPAAPYFLRARGRRCARRRHAHRCRRGWRGVARVRETGRDGHVRVRLSRRRRARAPAKVGADGGRERVQ